MSHIQIIKGLIPASIWNYARTKCILKTHRRVGSICSDLLTSNPPQTLIKPTKEVLPDKIIWQYWAQGFENVPELVKICLDSVDKYCGEYTVIRLSDENIGDYLELPSYIKENKLYEDKTKLSNLLRLSLLYYYGGIWIDSTVLLSGQIPSKYSEHELFAYYRDFQEPEKNYWKNTYAYYFSWEKGFKVNILTSVLFAKKGTSLIGDYYINYLKWWSLYDYFPDYFFIQILFDVLIEKGTYDYATENDCLPHHLMQSFTDSNYNLMTQKDILSVTPIHKLSYKSVPVEKLKELLNRI